MHKAPPASFITYEAHQAAIFNNMEMSVPSSILKVYASWCISNDSNFYTSIDQSTTIHGRGSYMQTIVTVCGEAQIGYSRPVLGTSVARPEDSACL
jgi:hypothetical protein